jgi:hypothetical protein
VTARRAAAALSLLALHAGAAGAQDRVSRIVMVGDAGTGDEEQLAVRDQLLRHSPSFVFLLGDNIYDWGDKRKFKSYFDDVYAPLMRQGVRFHAALGNHDVKECEASPEDPLPDDFNAYLYRRHRCDVEDHLTHPGFGYFDNRRYYSIVSDTSVAPLWETFVLDTNTLRTSQSKLPAWREDKAQLGWLDQALGRSRARWKIVIMHHPTHSPTTGAKYFFFVPFGGGRAREYQLDQQITPILARHRVDVVFAGHNHFYARMAPQGGIRYFVSGGGGRRVYPFVEAEGYVLAGGGYYHFMLLEITRSAFRYRVIDETGRVRDGGWWAKGDVADRPLADAGASAAGHP